MNKRPVKIIKRSDGKSNEPPPERKKAKKKRSIESTVESWISERRENVDTEDRSRNSKLAAWTADAIPA